MQAALGYNAVEERDSFSKKSSIFFWQQVTIRMCTFKVLLKNKDNFSLMKGRKYEQTRANNKDTGQNTLLDTV